MKRSASEFGFKVFYFFASTPVSDFRVTFRKLMVDLGAPFGYYRSNCFDRIVVFSQLHDLHL